MKCPGCTRELQPHELAQTMTILGYQVRPRSFCGACCHANLWQPGSPEALERLVTGKADEAAALLLAEQTASWIPAYKEAYAQAVAHDPAAFTDPGTDWSTP